MFTPDDFKTQLVRLLAQPYVPHDAAFFSGNDAGPDIESAVHIHRSPQAPFESSLHFLVNALRFRVNAEPVSTPDWPWFVQYSNAPEFKSMSEPEFNGLVEYHPCWWFRAQTAAPRGQFVQGVKLDDEWNEASAVVEFEGEYIFFYWATGA